MINPLKNHWCEVKKGNVQRMLDMLQSSPSLTRATSESLRRKDEKLKAISFILIFAFVFIFIFGFTFMYLESYSISIAIANIQNYNAN